MRDFAYRAPRTLDAACRALAAPGAVAKAGGLDLLDLIKERIESPSAVVHLGGLPDLGRIERDAGGRTRIGPLVTLAELAEDGGLVRGYPALAAAAASAATPQIRNQATLGGNLCQRPRCWYFRHADFACLKKGGETCYAAEGENRYHALFENGPCHIVHPSSPATALVAYDAVLTLSRGADQAGGTGPASGRGGAAGLVHREVAAGDFFTLPGDGIERENVLERGELVTAITLPPTGARHRHHYLKQREKQSFDWPIAEVAALLRMDQDAGPPAAAGRQSARSVERVLEARLVLGAASPRPYRAKSGEQMLIGKPVDPALARAVADEVVRAATPLADNAWRVEVFRALIRRALLAAAGVPDPALSSVGGAPALKA